MISKNKNSRGRKKGFTLVELLAVIVILAIILVIAVPKVMSVIEDAKKATLESTAKMIASAAEKQKMQNTVLGKTEEITCDSVAKINDVDYESCSIIFDNNIANVTIKGSGKFDGLYVCGGTKTNSTATKYGCDFITLSVDLLGGNTKTNYEEKYEAGSEVTLTDPTREGYSFMGWSVTGDSASISENKLKIGTSTTKITAIWEEYSEDYPTLISGPDMYNAITNMELRESIVEFEFVDSYTPTENDLGPIDASYDQDGSILAYVIPISETEVKALVVGNGSGGILLNQDSSMMFAQLTNLKEIKGMELLRWVNVENNDGMFSYTAIEFVNLGNSKIIGPGSFEGCTNLTSVTIPDSVTTIGDYAFYGCSGLTGINIPKGVTSIGNGEFSGCSSLTSINIPEEVTSIGNGAFYGCSGLTSINIPEGVTSIGSSAFEGCSALTSITIPSGVTSISDVAFSRCSSLTSINIPEGVTSIGDSAFYGCSKLTSVNIPEGVISIGTGAFYGCSGLTSINIPEGVTSIGNGAFSRCSSLTSINIPEGVTSIGSSAFEGCSALTSITIPSGVTTIGDSAFYGCSGLTSMNIHNSVTTIGFGSFRDCTNLKDVYYTGKEEDWNKIIIDDTDGFNDYLLNATKHFEYVVK